MTKNTLNADAGCVLRAALTGPAAAMAMVLMQSPAVAQDSSGQARASGNVVEEITVTARKKEEGLYSTPMAITAISEENLKVQGIDTMDDIGRYVPNLNITRFGVGNPAHAAIFIRGIGLQDHIITTDPGVGVYVDGVYLGRQMGANLNLKNVERVEVLRGPQGTLYGRNTIGGAVNIITKKPGEEEFMEFELQAGSRARAGINFHGSFKLADNLGFSATGGFTRRNGIGKALRVVDESKDVGELSEGFFRAAADWQVNDRFSLLFAVDGVQGENGQSPSTAELLPGGGFFTDPANVGGLAPPNNVPLTPGDIASDPDDTNTAQAGLLSQNNTGYGVSVTADWNHNENLDSRYIVSYRFSDYKGGLDDETAFQDFQSFPETGEAEQVSLEAQLNGVYGDFDFVTGLYYFHETGDTFSGPNTFINPGDTFDINQSTDSIAGYFSGSYQITDRFSASAGVRYTQDEKDADALFTNFPWFLPPPDGNGNGTPGSAQREFRSDDWDEATWDASVTYDFTDSLTGFFSISKGYQNGGYPARAFGGPNTFVSFDPTTALNYEVGIKGLVTDSWQLAASVFLTEYDDLALQFSNPTPAGFVTITANAGESEAKGVELESLWRFGEGFSLQTNVGYLNAEVTEVDPGTVGVAEGDSPALTPEWTISAGGQYDRFTQGGNMWTYRVDWSFRDSMFGQSINNEFNQLDSRRLVNFLIEYQDTDGDWSIGFYGDNIFNEEYDVGRLDQAFSGFTEVILNNDRSEFGVKYTKRFTGI